MQKRSGDLPSREHSQRARALLAGVAALSMLLVGGEALAQLGLPDAYNTPEDEPLDVAAPGVLANDIAIFDPLVAVPEDSPSNGLVVLLPDGSFSYSPDPDFNGTDSFTYRVSDGSTLYNVSTVTITVASVNDPPEFTSSAPTTVNQGAAYSYTAVATDADGDTLTYAAPTLPGWLTFTPGTRTLAGTPGQAEVGSHNVTLSVSDGGPAVEQSFTITVNDVNDPPVATDDSYSTAEDSELTVNQASGVLANDTDVDDSNLNAQLVADVAHGELDLNANTGAFEYTPDVNFNGSDSFTYRADDGSALSAIATVTITVSSVNDPPAFTSSPPTTVNEGAAYSYTAVATDADGNTLTYAAPTLPAWLAFNAGTRTLSGSPEQAQVGAHSVALTVTDGTVTVQQSFTVTVNNVNDPPVFTSTAPTTASEGTPYTYTATATDGDGNTLTYAAPTRPAWLSFNAGTRTLSGTPEQANVGAHNVTLSVNDGTVTVQQSFTITVANVNDPPAFTSSAPTTVNQGAAYTYAAVATDPDGNTLTYAAPTRPTWLAFNAGTRTLSGTPAQAHVGTHNVTLSVNDGTVTIEQSFTITVNDVNDAPVFTSIAPTTASQGTAYTYTATATDADGDTLTYAAPTLPAWLAFNAGTRTLSGTPAQAQVGAHSVTLSVNDGTVTVQQSFTITVANVNDPPAFTSTPPTGGSQGSVYTYTAAATDPDGDTLTYAAPTRPAWLVFNAGTRTLSGTPTQAQVGAHNVTLSVNDGTVTVQQSFTITVNNVNDAPVFTSTAPTSVNEDASYNYVAIATDPDGDPLTFAATGLPVWLSFNATTRALSGTPTQAQVGTYNVSITASDGVLTATQAFQVTVVSVNDAPVATAIPNQIATENVFFTLALAPFFTDAESNPLSFAATGLPPGLTIEAATGVVSGTPTLGTSVGMFAATVTVSDGASPTTAALNITVLRAGRTDLEARISVTPNPAAINTPATWTLGVRNNAPLVNVGSITLKAVFVGAVPFTFDAPSHSGCTVVPLPDRTEIDCVLGPLAGGQETSVTAAGRGSLAGDLSGTVTVSVRDAAPVDETPNNDVATTTLNLAQQVSSGPAQQISFTGARAAAAGDLDGDGFADLAVATVPGESTLVFLNIVDPTNTNKRTLSAVPLNLGDLSAGNDLAVADLDGDQDLDLVTANGPGKGNGVFLNSGTASFVGTSLGTTAGDSRAVAVGDVNGDTFLDIVFANASPNPVYTNQGVPGSFTQTDNLGNEVSVGVALLNLFGDSLPELVFANANGNASVYRNSGGRFQKQLDIPTGPTTSVAAADFNSDGLPDLVFGRETTTPGSALGNLVYLNTSSGATASFFASGTLGASPTVHVLAGDFDLDGDADIVAVNSTGSHQLYVNVGNASGTFALHAQQFAAAGARRAATGLLSVDKRVDLALVGTGGAAIFFNDGAGNFGQGDTGAPTLQLVGTPAITLTVGASYTDSGATANDSTDGDLTAKIVVTNPVDAAVLGTYTVTYNVTDLSGNAATPVTRTVSVQAREATGGGGGGGAVGPGFLALLALLAIHVRLSSRMFSGTAKCRRTTD